MGSLTAHEPTRDPKPFFSFALTVQFLRLQLRCQLHQSAAGVRNGNTRSCGCLWWEVRGDDEPPTSDRASIRRHSRPAAGYGRHDHRPPQWGQTRPRACLQSADKGHATPATLPTLGAKRPGLHAGRVDMDLARGRLLRLGAGRVLPLRWISQNPAATARTLGGGVVRFSRGRQRDIALNSPRPFNAPSQSVCHAGRVLMRLPPH